MKKFTVLFVIFVGLILRLYKINSPIADWHSFRQVDTISVTRYFTEHGFDFFHPKYYDISSTQSGVENPNGYRMVEAPIYNTIVFFIYQVSHLDLALISRLVSILFSLVSGWLIFLFVFNTTSQFLPSLFSLMVFMFLPFNVYYSRSTLPEPTAVFFMVLALFLFTKNIYLSATSLALSILIKPYTALILFPTLITLIFTHKTFAINQKTIIKLIIFTLISLLPFIMWRLWISNFPEGIPSSSWLLNNSHSQIFPAWYHGYDLSFLNKTVAFRPHWWYWLFQDRLAILILGIYGTIPFFLGLAYQRKHYQPLALSMILGIAIYFIIIAQGNIQHDYYQVLIIPFISILCGVGFFYIYQLIFNSRFLKFVTILFITLLSFLFSFNRIKEFYKINNPTIITVGQIVRQNIPHNSLLIAPSNGDTTLLYYTGFSGWPVQIYDIEDKIKQYSPLPIYLLSLNYDEYTNNLLNKYPIVIKNPDYVILKISP